MKAVVKTKRLKGFELIDVPMPTIEKTTDVLLRTISVTLCGTDLSIYKYTEWAKDTVPLNNINGHEGLFEVIGVGSDVKEVKVGDHVTTESHIYCGHCYSCRTGSQHMCDNGGILGVTRHGVWSEYTVLPSNILINVDGIPLHLGGILEPLGNAMHTAQYSALKGQHVLVSGGGPIGILAAMIAKAAGSATTTILEMNEYRIEMAKKAGINSFINPTTDDAEAITNKLTSGHGFGVILEMTGAHQALNLCIDLIAKAGDLNILSVYKKEIIPISLNKCVFKNIKIQTLNGRKMFSTWYKNIEMIKYGILDSKQLESIITHKFKLEEFEKGFELVESGKCGKVELDVSYLNSKK